MIMKASFTDKITAAEWIDLLISRADELRRAGVLELSPDRVVFAPYQEQRQYSDEAPADDEDAGNINPWTDALGMGLDPGTKIPSFRRQVEEADVE